MTFTSDSFGIALNYLKFKDFLVMLGFLTEHSAINSESHERTLLFDFWKILGGEEADVVYTENIRVLAQVIVRLIDIKRVLNIPA